MKQKEAEAEIDLTRFGDNPDPTEMNSPEKKKYSKILFDRSDVIMGNVS